MSLGFVTQQAREAARCFTTWIESDTSKLDFRARGTDVISKRSVQADLPYTETGTSDLSFSATWFCSE
jgi:hypothetical protein